jgi:DNA-binding IclR family transcriptional regulator
LQAELVGVREAGWASVREELEIGLNAVAAPIRDHTGNVVAAMSVSGPAYRLELTRFDVVAEMTIASAAAVSRRLGHVG